MEETNATPDQPQEKKAFVIRDTPVWLDQHQDWISDGARQLYKALRTLMDQRTGRLFIPGKGWIRIRTVEQKAGMSEETRLKYTKELKALGGIQIHRDHVTRSINGRNRKVWGQAEITVLSLKPPKAHKHSRSTTPGSKKPNTGKVSTTPGNSDNKEIEPQSKVSTTPGSTENLLHPDSSGPVDSGCQKMSEGPQRGASQDSPATTTPPAAKGLSSKPQYDYPTQTQSIVEDLKLWLRGFADKYAGSIPVWKMKECREHFLEETDALAIPFQPAISLYERTVRESLNPAPAKPTPQPTAKPTPVIDQVYAALASHPQGLSVPSLVAIVFNIPVKPKSKIGQVFIHGPESKHYYQVSSAVKAAVARLRKKHYNIVTDKSDYTQPLYVLRMQ